jgi:uridine kinase
MLTLTNDPSYERDIVERGCDMHEVINRYQNTLKPMHEQFIEPTKAFC